MMRTRLSLLLVIITLALAGCGKGSVAGKYHIEQDGNVFGAGAEKIILDLRSDKSFDVKAGPVLLLEGTWEAKSGQVTFSRGQDNIAVSYRVEGAALVPVQDGKDTTTWRWRKQ